MVKKLKNIIGVFQAGDECWTVELNLAICCFDLCISFCECISIETVVFVRMQYLNILIYQITANQGIDTTM